MLYEFIKWLMLDSGIGINHEKFTSGIIGLTVLSAIVVPVILSYTINIVFLLTHGCYCFVTDNPYKLEYKWIKKYLGHLGSSCNSIIYSDFLTLSSVKCINFLLPVFILGCFPFWVLVTVGSFILFLLLLRWSIRKKFWSVSLNGKASDSKPE